MALGALSRDTFKQQRLDALLRKHGHPEGWRTWLLDHRGRPLTVQQISTLIQQLGLTVDPTTVLVWVKQAIQEESRKPGPATPRPAGAVSGPGATRGPEAQAALRAKRPATTDAP